jgi:hypothetical protein
LGARVFEQGDLDLGGLAPHVEFGAERAHPRAVGFDHEGPGRVMRGLEEGFPSGQHHAAFSGAEANPDFTVGVEAYARAVLQYDEALFTHAGAIGRLGQAQHPDGRDRRAGDGAAGQNHGHPQVLPASDLVGSDRMARQGRGRHGPNFRIARGDPA